ncbi:MAG: class I SAM-dependent methyltransferase [Rhodospirillales bacterium]|nr:class I SAM-dependent methyltransferase [Rhodospirillales bacterium]
MILHRTGALSAVRPNRRNRAMSRLLSYPARQIREKYERMAPIYDRAEWLPGILGLRKLRRELFGLARGRTLEVAAGTGKNLSSYPADVDLTAIDLSPAMLAIAAQRHTSPPSPASFAIMDAEHLGFQDRTFDTVTSSLTLCTFPNPVRALDEMARVCRPEGSILLLEHGRSSREWLGRWQDRRSESHALHLACQWNRDPIDLVGQAGLSVRRIRRVFFGVFYIIEVVPARPRRLSSTPTTA